MSSKISILASSVIDQIAAGEVVDRPAHMIKELCENSLDAGATEITVDFNNGGRTVQIRDNGSGIPRDELKLAMARHATSKILSSDDLWKISSYGFRGEALASIGAVSRFKIISRTRDQELGAKLDCVFGKLEAVQDVGSDYGTQVSVEELFENVPARLKFLKSDVGESTAIKNQLKALALANFKVSFRILNKGELLFYWPAVEAQLERVKQILERSEMYEGEAQLDGYKARVVVSSPNETVNHSRHIHIIVQNRHVQDRSLQTAVVEAYRTLLMHGEYPAAVVYLECLTEDIDVNVSPTKSHVKFKEPGNAFRAVHRAVRSLLEKAPWLNQIIGSRPQSESHAPRQSYNQAQQSLEYKSLHNELLRDGLTTMPLIQSSLWGVENPTLESLQLTRKYIDQSVVFGATATSMPAPPTAMATPSPMREQPLLSKWAELDVLGQAHQTYIIVQKSDAIVFIDQHAAHERVMFEKLTNGYRGGMTEVQDFLLPISIHLSEEKASEIVKYQSDLEKCGISIDQIGSEEIAIRSAPAIVKPEALTYMIEKMSDDLLDLGASFQFEKMRSEIIATMACHSAIRAGQSLDKVEMVALLEQMDEFPLSSFCPHGRPVFVEYPIKKLEREFGRTI
jgi:DNA mismatch repair protein MutL